nr:sperm-tail PG-rich repeat-containing protein 2-like [Leptinotarsa decemlineata]
MYNNSPRMGIPLKSQTPPLLGPTTYIICDGRQTLKNITPFLSTEKRAPSFFRKSFCDNFYSLPDVSNKLLGTSPRNTAERFVSTINDNPGPGEYDPKRPKCSSDISRPIGRGRLYVCRMPYTLKGTGPSVPTKINANGYFVNESGDTIPLPPDCHDTSLGPAFYNVEEPADDPYRGNKWSKRSGKRFIYAADDSPGPGSYNVKIPACTRDVKNDEFREMARLLTFVPRFLDAQEMKLKRENFPGPADYDISKVNPCRRCDGIKPKPFVISSERLINYCNETPSPDTYTLSETKYTLSKKETGFQIQAPRFPKKKIDSKPGPDVYQIKSPILEKLQKATRYSTFRPPFNTSSARNNLELSKDVINRPCPFDYTVAGENKCRIFVSSVFKSKVKRFPKKCGKMEEMSPAHYNPIGAFNYTRNQQSHNIFEIPFNAMNKKRSVVESTNENPSPADYLSQGNIGCKGALIPSSKRFSEDTRNIPGPDTYWIHPYHINSVYKAYTTHNLKIRESILKKKLRYAPKETRERWASSLKKRQKMRWFVNDGRGYVHC